MKHIIIYVIWMQCLFYVHIQRIHTTSVRCSWGLWLPWDCTCCGNSIDKDVFRIRIKCCDGTKECAILRAMALTVLDEQDYKEIGSCIDNCKKEYFAYNIEKCVSSERYVNELEETSKLKLCQSTCLENITWNVTKRTSAPSTASIVSTIPYISTTTDISPAVNYPVVIGAVIGSLCVVLATGSIISYMIYKKPTVPSGEENITNERFNAARLQKNKDILNNKPKHVLRV